MWEKSDSDECLENTTVRVKGPNVDRTLQYKSDFPVSSMNYNANSSILPRNYRRDVSPISVRSMMNFQPRNFHMPYSRGMSSQRSMYRSRAGSPMSVRSIESNVSISATEVAMALKAMQYNKNEWTLITEAYRSGMKQHSRKRIEKRRKRRMFNKSSRNRFGYDSGEQGSDSSVSSDGRSVCRSVISSVSAYKMQNKEKFINDRSRDPRLLRDPRLCREIRLPSSSTTSSLYNDYNKSNRNVAETSQYTGNWEQVSQSIMQKPIPQYTLQNRFNNSMKFLSQRFNRSVAQPIQEENESQNILPKNFMSTNKRGPNEYFPPNDSDQEEVFLRDSQKQTPEKLRYKRRRSIDDPDDQTTSAEKKSKPTTPKIVKDNFFSQKESSNICGSEFQFAKPQLPVRKQKDKTYSEQVLNTNSTRKEDVQKPSPIKTKSPQKDISPPEPDSPQSPKDISDDNLEITQNTTEVSMRPSFMKRKLFTQTLDVTEKKNDSFGSSSSNSPLLKGFNSLGAEKSKTRKIMTNQSCLSRDIDKGNNLLDLIKKIVPLEQINATKIDANSTKTNKSINSKKSINDKEKWDITSIITSCNDEDGSDTFTDEEIFMTGRNKSKVRNEFNIKPLSQPNNKGSSTKKLTQQNVSPVKSFEKNKKLSPVSSKPLEDKNKNHQLQKTDRVDIINIENNATNSLYEPSSNRKSTHKKEGSNVPDAPVTPKKAIQNYVESFWNTDTDSDIERNTPDKRKNILKPLENRPRPTTSLQAMKPIINLNSTKASDRTSTNNKITKEKEMKKLDKNPNSKSVARKSKLGKVTEDTFNATAMNNFTLTCDQKFLKNSTKFIPNKSIGWASSTLRTQKNRTIKTYFEDKTMEITKIPKIDETLNELKNNDSMCKSLRNRQVDLSFSAESDANNTVLANEPKNRKTKQTPLETHRSRSRSASKKNCNPCLEMKDNTKKKVVKEKEKSKDILVKDKENTIEIKDIEKQKSVKDKQKDRENSSDKKTKETQSFNAFGREKVLQVQSANKVKTLEVKNADHAQSNASEVRSANKFKTTEIKNVVKTSLEAIVCITKFPPKELKADKENIDTIGRSRTRSARKNAIQMIESFHENKRNTRSRSRDIVNGQNNVITKKIANKELVKPEVIEKPKKLLNRDENGVLKKPSGKNNSDLSFSLNTSTPNRPFRKVREKSIFNRSASQERSIQSNCSFTLRSNRIAKLCNKSVPPLTPTRKTPRNRMR